MMSINAHRAFYNSSQTSYECNLKPPVGDIEELRNARDAVRQTLKIAFAEWEKRIEAGALFEDAIAKSLSPTSSLPTLTPKFRGQGSYVYGTLNQPAHCPPQEMDFDDGMFLPTSFVSQNGDIHPIVASSGYFKLVEEALQPLCNKRGWTLNPDKKRPSCVRISLNNARSHLDIALYALPDDQYQNLIEKVSASSSLFFSDGTDAGESIFESIYDTIPYDQIMLAHRDEGWKVSDPRKLENWFQTSIKEHGEQLRRVCRFLKGWRDHLWTGCRLSSIALMACAVRFYEEAEEDFVGRDDRALNAIAARLPEMLSQEIKNPVVNGRLDEGWDESENPCRTEFVCAAEALSNDIAIALEQMDAQSAIEKLSNIFGIHFPQNNSLIALDNEIGAPSIVSAGVLGSLGSSEDAKSSVRIDGDNRFA